MMSRKWTEIISPKYMHDTLGVYQGTWMPQMDRCWVSDDGYQVMSRLINTEWGKVEHATITRLILRDEDILLTINGMGDIPWSVKQEIKNELFGNNRTAIEVFPKDKNLVDVMDVYHLWIFSKDFEMPFGIHPTKDKQPRTIQRGCPNDPTRLIENYKQYEKEHKDVMGDDAWTT